MTSRFGTGERCPLAEHCRSQAEYWQRVAQAEREQRLAAEREQRELRAGREHLKTVNISLDVPEAFVRMLGRESLRHLQGVQRHVR